MTIIEGLFHSPQTLNGHVKKGTGSLIRLPGVTTVKWLQIGAALTFLSNTPSLMKCCHSSRYGSMNKGRHQNSLPLTTTFSQKFTEPSEGVSYPVGDLCRHFTKLTLSFAYTLHSYPILPTDGTNGFCDWWHTFHKQVTNVSQHVFVILLWGIFMSPLKQITGRGLNQGHLRQKVETLFFN